MKLRARRLATAALECLTEHDKGFARERGFVEPLTGVVQLATRGSSAGADGGVDGKVATEVLTTLAGRDDLFARLRRMILARMRLGGERYRAYDALETLVRDVSERALETCADAVATPEKRFAPQILTIPSLWRRAGGAASALSVESAGGERWPHKVWARAVESLRRCPPASLPAGDDTGSAFPAIGWLLGNIAEAAAKAPRRRGGGDGSAREKWFAANGFAAFASDALRQFPPGALIWSAPAVAGDAMDVDGESAAMDVGYDDIESDDEVDSDDDDDEGLRRAAARRRAAAASGGAARVSTPPQLVEQLKCLRNGALLKWLVIDALPGEDDGWSADAADEAMEDAPTAPPPPPAFGFGAAAAPAFGAAARPPPPRPTIASSTSSASSAAQIGVRSVAALVASVSARSRASERGALMSALAFGTPLVRRAWRTLRAFQTNRAWPRVTDDSATQSVSTPWLESLGAFAAAYGTFLLTGDDEEFAAAGDAGEPLPAEETPTLVACLRDALWRILWVDVDPDGGDAAAVGGSMQGGDDAGRALAVGGEGDGARGSAARALARALAQVHDRNGRLRLIPPESFHAPELFRQDDAGGGDRSSSVDAFLDEATNPVNGAGDKKRTAAGGFRRNRAAELLRRAPILVPFGARVRWFKNSIFRDRNDHAGRGGPMEAFGFTPEHHIQVTRGRVFADALDALGPAALKHENRRWRDDHVGERPPGSLKGVVRVNFVNEHGVEEAGVDGGGLFKDFLSALIEEAFDPKVGLFVETPDRTLYPNPASWKHAGADHLRKLEFLGAMLGKAVYEGILVDLPLAGFFLAKLRDGRPPELNDLATLDPELYHHLLSLKRLPARDVEDLFLHFTASDPDGVGGDVDLIPGGSEIRVDGENRGRYVHLLAHHLMHARIRRQSKAFVDGFRGLIEPSWLRVFAPAELRLLISGAGGKIDIDDLARSATYSGGYTADHPTVTALWDALRECREEDQRAFLKFVTACPNTPLLGFSQLMPPFCVHRSGMSSGSRASEDTADLARLPTAATCMNLLKLPPYKTKDAVKEKLLYAVTSGSGFDLS